MKNVIDRIEKTQYCYKYIKKIGVFVGEIEFYYNELDKITYTIKIGYSLCCKKDQFIKKLGRRIALTRLTSNLDSLSDNIPRSILKDYHRFYKYLIKLADTICADKNNKQPKNVTLKRRVLTAKDEYIQASDKVHFIDSIGTKRIESIQHKVKESNLYFWNSDYKSSTKN